MSVYFEFKIFMPLQKKKSKKFWRGEQTSSMWHKRAGLTRAAGTFHLENI